MKIPILVMQGSADPIVPVGASAIIEENVGSEDKTRVVYDGLRHEILNEPEQDQVIEAIIAWLDARA